VALSRKTAEKAQTKINPSHPFPERHEKSLSYSHYKTAFTADKALQKKVGILTTKKKPMLVAKKVLQETKNDSICHFDRNVQELGESD